MREFQPILRKRASDRLDFFSTVDERGGSRSPIDNQVDEVLVVAELKLRDGLPFVQKAMRFCPLEIDRKLWMRSIGDGGSFHFVLRGGLIHKEGG